MQENRVFFGLTLLYHVISKLQWLNGSHNQNSASFDLFSSIFLFFYMCTNDDERHQMALKQDCCRQLDIPGSYVQVSQLHCHSTHGSLFALRHRCFWAEPFVPFPVLFSDWPAWPYILRMTSPGSLHMRLDVDRIISKRLLVFLRGYRLNWRGKKKCVFTHTRIQYVWIRPGITETGKSCVH